MKGAMGIDGSKGEDFLTKGKDDGDKPARDISGKYGSELKQACDPWDEPTWKPGKVSSSPKKGGRGASDGTDEPVKAYSPSGKYAKTGGRGKGFGS